MTTTCSRPNSACSKQNSDSISIESESDLKRYILLNILSPQNIIIVIKMILIILKTNYQVIIFLSSRFLSRSLRLYDFSIIV